MFSTFFTRAHSSTMYLVLFYRLAFYVYVLFRSFLALKEQALCEFAYERWLSFWRSCWEKI